MILTLLSCREASLRKTLTRLFLGTLNVFPPHYCFDIRHCSFTGLNIFHIKCGVPRSGLITRCYFSAVNSRVPSGATSSSHTTESPTPEPCSQASSNVPSQSVLPMYPSVDIDAHVSNHSWLWVDLLKGKKFNLVLT